MLKLKLVLAAGFVVGITAFGAGKLTQATLASIAGRPKPVVAAAQPPAPKDDKPHLDLYGDKLPDGAVARLGTVRFRHEGEATTLAFSPDGKTLVGNTNSGIIVWNATTGQELYRLPINAALDIAPDGTTLALQERRGPDGFTKISLLELSSGKKIRTISVLSQGTSRIRSPATKVLPIRFAPGAQKLAYCNDVTANVDVLDIVSGQVIASLAPTTFGAYNLAFSPDCKTLVLAHGTSGDPQRGLELWNVATGNWIRDLENTNKAYVHAIAFSPDGKMLAFGTTNRIFLSDPATGKELKELQDLDFLSGPVTGLAFTPDGKTLVAGTETDGNIRIWDVATGKARQTLEGRMSFGRSMALSPDGKTVALGAAGQTVRLWDVATGKELFTEFRGHDSQINCLAFSPDGKTMVSGGDYMQIRLWDTPTSKQSQQLERIARTLSFSPDGKRVVSTHQNGTARIWDVTSGDQDAAVIEVPFGDVLLSANFSPDARKVFTLDRSFFGGRHLVYRVRHWDAATMEEDRVWTIPEKSPTVVLAPNGRTVLAALDNGAIGIFDIESSRQLSLRGPMKDLARTLALSDDGRFLATGAGPQATDLRLWEILTAKEIYLMKGQDLSVSVIAWSPDGRMVASGEQRNQPGAIVVTQSVRLFDTATGKELARFCDFKADVTALAFSTDGLYLAAGLKDSTILVWEVGKVAPKMVPLKLDSQQLEACWAELAGQDARQAHQAVWTMIAAPQQSVASLQSRLKPVTTADIGKVQQLIAELDSDKFAVRKAAAKELERLGEQVKTPIEKALKGNLTLEARQRLELISKTLHDIPGPATLQVLRAIMVLESIGSPDARSLLHSLARGAEGARETEEAKVALARLARQSP